MVWIWVENKTSTMEAGRKIYQIEKATVMPRKRKMKKASARPCAFRRKISPRFLFLTSLFSSTLRVRYIRGTVASTVRKTMMRLDWSLKIQRLRKIAMEA